MSKTSRLLNAMLKGQQFTAAQLQRSWGFSNPHDPIYRLRQRGYPIYSNVKTLSDGREAIRYRLNTNEILRKV